MPYQSLAATTFCGPDGTAGAVLAGGVASFEIFLPRATKGVG